jgi:outer membrane receptor protein involved in Fe transport
VGEAVETLREQTGARIEIAAEGVRTLSVRPVSGDYTVEQALDAMLEGTGFEARSSGAGSYSIVRSANDTRGDADFLPEILVSGVKAWSLNTGITRSADDAQPFVVIGREEILRSGATSLENFLKNSLGAAAGASTGEQGGGLNRRGVTRINLRGLGTSQTLILVDGRRLPGPNLTNGELEQGSLNGIPLASIERIEVLASSAAGIYGGSATGGVINIILRRDYKGVEMTGAYGSTYDGGGDTRRIDLAGGRALFDGRTQVSFSASWQKNDSLLYGERDLYQRGLAHLSAINPSFQLSGDTPPLGATPNIRSVSGSVLVLRPEFGGRSLGAANTYVPYGYRGIAQDGVAGLIANAGRYNLDLANVANTGAMGGTLLGGSKEYSGQFSVRHQFTSWASGYFEIAGSRTDSSSPQNIATREHYIDNPVQLDKNGRPVPITANTYSFFNNPFTDAILVNTSGIGQDFVTADRVDSLRAVAGVILKLGYNWQAVADFSRSWSKRTTAMGNRILDYDTLYGYTSGKIPTLVDTAVVNIDYGYFDNALTMSRFPAETDVYTASLRLAGPIPVRLPGGKPMATIMIERTERPLGVGYQVSNSADYSFIRKSPEREMNTNSAYLEIRAPLISPKNNIVLFNRLEFQASARYDQYVGTGALSVECLSSRTALKDDLADDFCDSNDTLINRAENKSDRLDPMYSLRWNPVSDIMFRASYATSFTPPSLSRLVKNEIGRISTDMTDILRSGERIGVRYRSSSFYYIEGPNYNGGNPDLKPEESISTTFGIVYSPKWQPSLRFSVDWTKIDKTQDHYSPSSLLTRGSNRTQRQLAINELITLFPERFKRAAPSDGYSVGKIISSDLSWMNLAGSSVEAIDYTIEYGFPLAGGQLDITGRATQLREMSRQLADVAEPLQYAGVLDSLFQREGNGNGGLKWRGNLSAVWSNDRTTLGTRMVYFDSYYLNVSRQVVASQAAASIRAQRYFDLFGSYIVNDKVRLNVNINNFLNTKPPIDVTADELYSRFGDPRGATYTLSMTASF